MSAQVLLVRLRYSGKLLLSPYLLVAFLLCLGTGGVIAYADTLGLGTADYATFRTILLLILPLLAVILFANTLSSEWEDRTLAMQFSFPFSPVAFLLERILLGLCLYLLMVAILIGFGHYGLTELTGREFIRLMREVLPASLYLGALGFLGSLIARNVLAGLGLGLGYWLFETISMGRWTKSFFLFHPAFGNPSINNTTNGTLLFALFVCGILLSFIIYILAKRLYIISP